MTQEGTQQFHADMAISSHLAARAHTELARAFTMAAAAHEAFRGRLAAQELAVQEMAEAAERQTLRDTVAPAPPAKGRQEARPLPDYMMPSAAPLEAMVPWFVFWKDTGLTSLEAVELIRAELPGALRPETGEEATWPSDDDPAERQYAATKLTGLEESRAVAAQTMILTLLRKQAAK